MSFASIAASSSAGSSFQRNSQKSKPIPTPINPDQVNDVLEVIDVTVERGLRFRAAGEDGVDPDDAAARADHPDLLVAQVALDVVKAARVAVRDDQRLAGQRADFLEAGGVDVRQVEDDPEPLAFLHQLAPETR